MPSDPDPHGAPHSAEELDEVVCAFEAGTLPRALWTHEAHLAVGAHYVFHLGAEAAINQMRTGVRAYNVATGTPNTANSGFHETLTRMWVVVLARLRQHSPATRLEFVQRAIRQLGPLRDLHRLLYDFDVVADGRARQEWIEPTRELPEDFFCTGKGTS